MKWKKTLVILSVFLGVALWIFGKTATIHGQTMGDKLLDHLKEEVKPVAPLLPPEVKVMPGYEMGAGPAVGTMQMLQGQVLVVHKGQSVAYALLKDHPLFEGDTLVTGERSRANAMLNDKSVFSLAPLSKLVLDETVYRAENDERSTLVSLLFGRARFIVAAIQGKSRYDIKTPTAVCGLRGSDLALAVAPDKVKTSAGSRFMAWLNPVRVAHAQVPLPLLTVVVTGPGTSVSFAGAVGAAQIVGPVSVSAAAVGASALTPITVGAAAAGAALGTVGPGLAAMSMPPARQ